MEEPIQPKTWRERISRQGLLLHHAHRGMMLNKILRQNKIVEENARQQLGVAYGEDTAKLAATDEDEDMGVSVGNENHYHFQTTSAPTPITNPSPENQNLNNSKQGKIPQWLTIGTLLASSGIIGASLNNHFNPATPNSNTLPTPEDQDTISIIKPGFGTPIPFKDITERN